MARDMVAKLLDNDPTRPILPEMVDIAVQRLILRRDTHLDSLMERLREPRVRRNALFIRRTSRKTCRRRASDECA